MNHKMSSEQILFDILSYAIKHNEFSVFNTNLKKIKRLKASALFTFKH